jgi:hypothetical protein
MGRGEPIRSFEFERLEVPGVELLLGGQSSIWPQRNLPSTRHLELIGKCLASAFLAVEQGAEGAGATWMAIKKGRPCRAALRCLI